MSLTSFLSKSEISEVIEFDGAETHLHFKGEAERLADVFSWGRINKCLNTVPLPSPAIRLFKDGVPLSYNDALDIIRETGSGATLIFDDLDQHDAKLGRLLDVISSEMGFRTRTNLYLSYPETQGFHAHYDTHSFLILQIAGTKEWKIYKNRADAPLYVQKSHERLSKSEINLDTTVLLEQGDVLFVPKGQWHEATAKDGPSVHLTLALFAPTGIDFLSWLVDEMREDADCRKDLPWGRSELERGGVGQDERLQKAIETISKSLRQALGDEQIGARFLAHKVATEKTRNRLHFPEHVSTVHEIEQDELLVLAVANLAYFATNDDKMFDLVGGGLSMPIPTDLLPIVDMMISEMVFTLKTLEDVCPQNLQHDLKSLVGSLLSYGVISRRMLD